MIFTVAQSAAFAPSKKTTWLVPFSHSNGQLKSNCPTGLVVTQLPWMFTSFFHSSNKLRRRQLLCSRWLSTTSYEGTHFIPLVAGTLSELSENSIATIRSLDHAISHTAGSADPSVSIKQLLVWIAITVWCGKLSPTLILPSTASFCNTFFCCHFYYFYYFYTISLPFLKSLFSHFCKKKFCTMISVPTLFFTCLGYAVDTQLLSFFVTLVQVVCQECKSNREEIMKLQNPRLQVSGDIYRNMRRLNMNTRV